MIVISDHDHGYPMILVAFLFHRLSHVVMMGGYLLTLVRIVVVRGGYQLPYCEYTLGL
jgi:hypothetical protein